MSNYPSDFGIQEQADYFGRSKRRSHHEREDDECDETPYDRAIRQARIRARKLQAMLVECQDD